MFRVVASLVGVTLASPALPIASSSARALGLPSAAMQEAAPPSTSLRAFPAGSRQTGTLLAARRGPTARKPKPPKAPKGAPAPTSVEPVKVRSAQTGTVTIKQKRKDLAAYLVEPGTPLALELPGAGKLALALYQLLPTAKGKRESAVTAQLVVDSQPPRKITLTPKPMRGVELRGGPAALLGTAKGHTEKLGAGTHRVEVSLPAGARGIVVFAEFIPTGAKKPAPIVIEPAAPSSTLAALAATMSDDDSEGEGAPATPPEQPLESAPTAAAATPPAAPATSAPATKPSPTPATAAATPSAAGAATPTATATATTKPATSALGSPSGATTATAATTSSAGAGSGDTGASTQLRIAAGEIRDGVLGTYESVFVLHDGSPDKESFYKVAEQRSFSVMMAGPGELTIRLHRLMRKAELAAPQPAEYRILLFEDDVLLQQLNGVSEPAETYSLDPEANPEGLLLTQPKEYHFKVGAKKATVAVQITGAADGMVARYSFAAEANSLAALALSMGDDEDGGGGAGDDDEDALSLTPVTPTVVMEVDVRERKAVREASGPVLGFGIFAGATVPTVGNKPGLGGSAEFRVALPFWDSRMTAGVHAGYQQQQLEISVGDLGGASIDASSQVFTVPILFKLGCRLLNGESFGLYLNAAGGVSYVSVHRSALEATAVETRWLVTGRAGLGLEYNVGLGWLGLEAAYLYVPQQDYGNALRSYSPGGAAVGLVYRLGI